MELIPTQDEVIRLLRDTGALRTGHFIYPSGLHSEEYLQLAMAMRYYQHARTLGVGLSRKVRAHTELRAMIGELSIVAPGTGGIPVAYAMCEALRANQVYWAERDDPKQPLYFRAGVSEQKRGEKVLLADDMLRSGRRLTELRKVVEDLGDEVVGLAVMVYQPNPQTQSFGDLPFFYLAQLSGRYWRRAEECELCKAGMPAESVYVPA
jgi:orotate phosphoribosyltransferase